MLDVARRGEAASPRKRTLENEDGSLVLSSDGTPKTVYVNLGKDGIGFGADERGPFYADMAWNPSSGNPYDLFIEFVLMAGITGIVRSPDAPTIFLSAPFDGGTRQDGCAPMVSEQTTYSFNVQAGNMLHDPKIVVTPQ